MVVARYALGLRQTLILHGLFQHCAAVELPDAAPLDFLPRGLAGRVGVTAGRLQFLTALGEFLRADQDVGTAFAQVDPDTIAVADQREAAADGSFRAGIQMRYRRCPIAGRRRRRAGREFPPV